jgi:GNAT superfamily N-acetyltransferase
MSDESGRHLFNLEAGSLVGITVSSEDGPEIADFLLEHGHTEWNYLPPDDEVREYIIKGFADGLVFGLKALYQPTQELVGIATYELGRRYPQYQPPGREDNEHGYISEMLVREDFRKRGLGTALVRTAIGDLTDMGAREVYTDRDAYNIGSDRTLTKAGMVVIDEFPDPKKRTNGSGMSVLARFMAEH